MLIPVCQGDDELPDQAGKWLLLVYIHVYMKCLSNKLRFKPVATCPISEGSIQGLVKIHSHYGVLRAVIHTPYWAWHATFFPLDHSHADLPFPLKLDCSIESSIGSSPCKCLSIYFFPPLRCQASGEGVIDDRCNKSPQAARRGTEG